ncbi:MAG: alpha/beta hydrolase [Bacilli bacterium]
MVRSTEMDRSSEIGVLLIHGFASSPGIWREMRHVLRKSGFQVSAPCLAGHGKGVEDLAKAHWFDWVDSVRKAYQELRSTTSRVFVVGHSLGASLGLYFGASIIPPSGLVLMAPSVDFSFKNRFALGTVGRFVKTIPIKGFKANREGLQRTPDLGATAMPISAVRANLEFKGLVRAMLPAVSCPVLILVGKEDRLVPRGSAEYILSKISAMDQNRELVILPNSQHAIPLDLDREVAFELSVQFIKRTSGMMNMEAIRS